MIDQTYLLVSSWIASPWLQVLALMAALALWVGAIGALTAWLRAVIKAPKPRDAISMALVFVVLASALCVALVFGKIGQASTLGRQPGFLAYWIVLLILSFAPYYYFLRRHIQ